MTPHAVYTLKASAFRGTHMDMVYSLEATVCGYLQDFMSDGWITNADHPETTRFLRRFARHCHVLTIDDYGKISVLLGCR